MSTKNQLDINKHASRYDDWKEEYNWEKCKTNREEYGKFLCSFLTSTEDSLVVNLNGSWGTGKTELLRRLYIELATRKHAVVYIDTWESDFSNDALAVVCSELLTQLGNIFDKNNAEANEAIGLLKKGFSKCLGFTQGAAMVFGDLVTAKAAKGGELIVNAIPELTDNSVCGTNLQLVEKVQQSQLERVQAMKDIKKQITFLSELMHEIYGLDKQIVILVDELDRCRPNYAIEILEVIKHFFQTKGCVFLVATDTEALQHSVGAIYGTEFKSEDYLKRFFDRKISLSEVSTLDYLKCKGIDLSSYVDEGIVFSSFQGSTDQHIKFFSDLFTFHKMKLRDIDQALQKFFASLDFIVPKDGHLGTVINGIVLMTGIIEESYNPNVFKSRTSNEMQHMNINHGSFTNLINLHLSLVSKKFAKSVYDWSGNNHTYHANSSMLGIQSINPTLDNDAHGRTLNLMNINGSKVVNMYGLLGNDGNIIEDIINFEKDEEHRYWLWDDYRKIIELSGHIE